MLLASGPESRWSAYERCAAHVTTGVSPHEGHMTSIGRRLVDRSIGLPHRRQVIDMGDVGGVWTGPSGGGGGPPFAPIGATPPPTRLHSPITAIRSSRNRTPRTMPKTRTPPDSVGQNPLSDAPTLTRWNWLA